MSHTSHDPFTPDAFTPEPLPSFDSGMPPTVVAAIAIEALLAAQTLLTGFVLWAGIGAALCVGLHHRVVLAQRLVMIGAVLGTLVVGGFMLAVAFSVSTLDDGPSFGVLGLGLAPGLIYIAARIGQLYALTRRDARAFFRLRCPSCGSHGFRAESLSYKRLACQSCGHGWRTGRQG